MKIPKEDIPRSIRNSDHLTGEIGFVVKERRSAYGKKTKGEWKKEMIIDITQTKTAVLSG